MSKFKFYFLSFTWGLPVTLAGCLVAFFMRITGHKPKKWGYCYYFELGNGHSGADFGVFFVKGKPESLYLKNHELGHAVQNCYFGFLMPFIVNIPSTVRFWFRAFSKKINPQKKLKPYDSVWFEGQATHLGSKLIAHLESEKLKNNKAPLYKGENLENKGL